MSTRIYAVTPPQPARPMAAGLKRPGVDIRRVPGLAMRQPERVDAMNREDDDAARELDRAQQDAARERDRQAKADADTAKKDYNSAVEAEFRSRDVEHYTDAHGIIQPVVDPVSGKPVRKAFRSEPQVDKATGRVFRMERPAGADAQTKQVFEDEDADYGPGDDPADPHIYRKNKHSRPEKFDPEQGLTHDDPKLRAASAKALKDRALKEHKRRLVDLDIEDDEASATAGRPTSAELKEANLDFAAEDPATKARGQAVLDRAKEFSGRATKRAQLRREEQELEKQTPEEFAAKFIAGKQNSGTPVPDATGQRLAGLKAVKAGLEAEDAELKAEEERVVKVLESGYTASESGPLRSQLASLQNRRAELSARDKTYNAEVQQFNEWQQKRQEDAVIDSLWKQEVAETAADAAKAVRDVFGGKKPAAPVGDKPGAAPSSPLKGAAAHESIQKLGTSASGRQFLKVAGKTWEMDDHFEKLPEIMASHEFQANGWGTDIYAPVKNTMSGDAEDSGDSVARAADVLEKSLLASRPHYRERAVKLVEEFKVSQRGLLDAVENGEAAFMARSGASDADVAAAEDRDFAAWAKTNRANREHLEKELSRLRFKMHQGAVPANLLLDAYRAAGKDTRVAPDVGAVVDAAGDAKKQDVATTAARLKAIKDYEAEWSDTPFFDSSKVTELANKLEIQATREQLRHEQGALVFMGREVAKFFGGMMVNGTEGLRALWNSVTGDKDALKDNIGRVQAWGEVAQSREWRTMSDFRDQFGQSASASDIGHVFGQVAAQMGPNLIMGAGSASIGKVLSGRALGGVTRLGMAGAVKEVMKQKAIPRQAALSVVKSGMIAAAKGGKTNPVSEIVSKNALAVAEKMGMRGGIFASSVAQNGSEYIGRALANFSPEDVDADFGAVRRAVWGAAVAAVPAGALDMLDQNEMKFAEAILKTPARKLKQGFVRRSAEILKDFGLAVGKEGATGFGQGVIGVLSQRWTKGIPFSTNLTGAEVKEIMENAALEAMGGGQMHLVTAAVTGARQAYQTHRAGKELKVAEVRLAQAKAGLENSLMPLSPAMRAGERAVEIMAQEYDAAVAAGDRERALQLRQDHAGMVNALADEAREHGAAVQVATEQLDAAGQKASAVMQQAQASGDAVAVEQAQAGLDAANRARAVVRIAGGMDLATLPDAELRAVGYERDSSGTVKPLKDVVPAVTKAPGGTWIITDAAIAEAGRIAPAAAELVGDDELTARKKDAVRALQKQSSAAAGTTAGESENLPQAAGVNPAPGSSPGRRFAVTVKSAGGKTRVVEVDAKNDKEARAMVRAQAANGETVSNEADAVEEISGAPLVGDGSVEGAAADAVKGEPSPTGDAPSPGQETTPAGDSSLPPEVQRDLNAILDEFGSIFTGVRYGSDHSGGLSYGKNGELVINVTELLVSLSLSKNPRELLLAMAMEEVVHAVAVQLDGKKFNLSAIWRALPESVRKASRKAYRVQGKMSAEEREFQEKHEFFRMVLTRRVKFSTAGIIVDGKTTEEHYDPSLLEHMAKVIEAVVDFLKNYRKELKNADPDVLAALDSAIAEATEALEALPKAAISPIAAWTKQRDELLSKEAAAEPHTPEAKAARAARKEFEENNPKPFDPDNPFAGPGARIIPNQDAGFSTAVDGAGWVLHGAKVEHPAFGTILAVSNDDATGWVAENQLIPEQRAVLGMSDPAGKKSEAPAADSKKNPPVVKKSEPESATITSGFVPLGQVAPDGTFKAANQPRTKSLKFHVELVDLAKAGNSKGTKYQPREIDRVERKAKVNELAAKWDPSLAVPGASIEHGPVAITRDGKGEAIVRSGHHRQAALAILSPEKMAEQREFLKNYLNYLGRPEDAAQVDGMEQPALAAEIVDFGDYAGDPDPLLSFVRDANPDTMSRPEEAIKKAGVLRQNTAVVDRVRLDDNGEFIEDGDAGEAVLKLIDLLGLRNYLTADGRTTPEMYDDVRRALLAYVLDADTAEGRKAGRGATLRQLIEDSGDNRTLTFAKALVRSAGVLAQIKRARPEFIGDAIAPAVQKFVAWKKEGGKGRFREFLEQAELFDSATPDIVKRIGIALDSANGVNALRTVLETVIEEEAYGADLFTGESAEDQALRRKQESPAPKPPVAAAPAAAAPAAAAPVAAPTHGMAAADMTPEQRQEQAQVFRDMMARNRENGKAIPQGWVNRLAELEGAPKAQDGEIYANIVEGHPQHEVSHAELRNLIPIKIRNSSDLRGKFDQAQALFDKWATLIGRAEYAIKTAKTPAQKKKAQAALSNLGAEKAAFETLKSVIIPELNRLNNEALKREEAKPASVPVIRPKPPVAAAPAAAPGPAKSSRLPAGIINGLLSRGHEIAPSGPGNIAFRQSVMLAITGKKTPAAKSGVNAVESALGEFYGVSREGKTPAEFNDDLRKALNNDLMARAATPSSPSPESASPLRSQRLVPKSSNRMLAAVKARDALLAKPELTVGQRKRLAEAEAAIQEERQKAGGGMEFRDIPEARRYAGFPAMQYRLAEEETQGYLDFYEVPPAKRADKAAAVKTLARAVSRGSGKARGPDWPAQKERAQRAWRGLIGGDASLRAEALAALEQGPVSSLLHGLVNREIPSWDVRGAVVDQPADVLALVQAVRSPFVESLKVLVLDSKQRVIGSRIITVGSINETVANPREIVAALDDILRGFKGKVSGFLISHNHPSGDPSPSLADKAFTKRLNEVSNMYGVPLLDHVVTNGTAYFSFKEHGLLHRAVQHPMNHPRLALRDAGTAAKPEWQQKLKPATAAWEVVGLDEKPEVDTVDGTRRIAQLITTADPGHAHLVYLSTRLKVMAVERVPMKDVAAARAMMISGVGREGANGVIVLMPAVGNGTEGPSTGQHSFIKSLRAASEIAGINLVDASAPNFTSTWREAGLLEKPAEYGTGAVLRSQRMVTPGGLTEADYRMGHQPNPDGPRLHDLLEGDLSPRDIYQHPEWYVADISSREAKESIAAVRAAKGKPNAIVTIYRAAPAGTAFQAGNWISLSKTYAKQHGMMDDNPDNDMPVISMKVPASHIRWDGNDLNEFGYFPPSEQSPAPADGAESFSLKRITPAQDAEYMAAVESGDVAKQQAMVGASVEQRYGLSVSDAAITQVNRLHWVNGAQEQIDFYTKKLAELPTEAQAVAKWRKDKQAWADAGISTVRDERSVEDFLRGLDLGLTPVADSESDVIALLNMERKAAERELENAKESLSRAPEGADATPFETGKPVTVKAYHATPFGRLETFDDEMLGTFTGAPSAQMAHFFAGSADVAETYFADHGWLLQQKGFFRLSKKQKAELVSAVREELDDNPSNEDVQELAESLFDQEYDPSLVENELHNVFIHLKNPLVHDFKGSGYRDASYREILEKAEAAGHDGVILANTYDAGPAEMFDDIGSPTNIIAVLRGHSNQIKSADPVTRDSDGNVIPLSQRFNPESDSILRSRSFASMLKQAGVDVEKLDADMALAALEEAAGEGFTVGRPDLALGAGVGPENWANSAVRAVHEQHAPEAETQEQWREAGAAMLRGDFRGTVNEIRRRGLAGETLTPELTAAAKLFIESEGRRKMTPARVRSLQQFVNSYVMTGTEAAHALGSRVYPWKGPEERHREYLVKAVLGPTPEQRARQHAAKERRRKGDNKERAAAEAELRRVAEEMQARLARIEAEFARQGWTLDNLFSGGVKMFMQNSPAAKAAVASMGSTARQKAAEMLREHKIQGDSRRVYKHIANATGLTLPEVEKVHDEVMAKFREEMKRDLRERMAAAAKARAGDGLKSQNVTGVHVDMDALLAMTPEQQEAELERMANEALGQTGWVPKEKLGKMTRRKRKPLFKPPVGAGKPANTVATAEEWEAFKNKPVGKTPFGTQPKLDLGDLDADDSITGEAGAWGNFGQLWSEAAWEGDILVETGKDIARPDVASRMARMASVVDASGLDVLLEYWTAGLFSGMRTQMANFAGGLIGATWEYTVQRFTEMAVNSVVRDAKGARAGELKYVLRGILPGFQRGIANAMRTWAGEGDYFKMDVLRDKFDDLARGAGIKGEGRAPAISEQPLGQIGRIIFGERGEKVGLKVDGLLNKLGNGAAKPIAALLKASGMGRLGAWVEQDGRLNPVRGRVVRLSFRTLAFVDAVFKGVLGHMEAGAQAYRLAKSRGLSGAEMERFINTELGTPGSEAWRLAVQKAEYLLFQQALRDMRQVHGKTDDDGLPEGYASNAKWQPVEASARAAEHLTWLLQRSSTGGGKIVRFIFPVIRAAYRIIGTATRKSVGSTLLAAEELLHGGILKIKDGKAITETHPAFVQHVAESLVALGLYMVLRSFGEGDDDDDKKGILITGSPHRSPGEKELQKRTAPAYGVRIFGEWFSYGRYEPVSGVVGNLVDILRAQKSGSTRKMDAIQDNLMGQMMDKTFMQGFKNMVEAWQYKSKDETRVGNILERMRSFALKGAVPNLIRQGVASVDDTERDYKNADWWYDALPLPGGAPPRVNLATGEEVKKTGNVVSRIFIPYLSKPAETPHPADVALRKWHQAHPELDANDPRAPGLPQQVLKIDGKNVELGNNAWLFYQKRSAALARQTMPASFPAVPTERDIARIKKVYDDARERARDELKRWPVEKLTK